MNNKATLTVIGSLGDFLHLPSNQSIEILFDLHPSVKDLIESQGIPHTALFKIEINGKEKTFDYNLQEGDHILAYPFEAVDRNNFDPVFSSPRSFIVDVHLGKLAKTLRLLGFDTHFDKNWNDKDIIRRSTNAQHMILTRDIELLKNGAVHFGYWVRSTDPDQQIIEIFQRFALSNKINAFSRCMKCNGELHEVKMDKIKDQVPPKVKERHSLFFECSDCGQVYWQGSHFKKLRDKVNRLIELDRR